MMLLQLLAAGVLGALLTYGYTRWRGREDAEVKRLRARLTAKTDELAAYKTEVQGHFLDTAEALDALTSAHRNVFEQLERGAQRLVGDGRQGALTPDALKPDALEQIARRVPPELAGSDTGGAAEAPVSTPEPDALAGTAEDVLDNPASAAQRLPPNLTPSRN